MKKLILALTVTVITSSAQAVAMNLEGSCAGTLKDGSPVAFQYYSNFDGCKKVSKAAISYHYGQDGMVTGTRRFTDADDIYAFGKTRVVFKNSTGNTTGRYEYVDQKGSRQSVVLDCDVRDYHYGECG